MLIITRANLFHDCGTKKNSIRCHILIACEFLIDKSSKLLQDVVIWETNQRQGGVVQHYMKQAIVFIP